ncbi:hypothetical protein [Clostridium cadaveris]|uniref:hypothetical protein n=1 Tax=Clostridium cadaveris TaxID=1529 RepID=UPI0031E04A3A
MSEGWIKLHRCLFKKAIWLESTPEQKTILITLLGMANHEEKQWIWKGNKYIAKPGQFVTSLKSIADKAGTGITIQNVRTALAKFEKYDFLTNESTNKNRLITIVNWEFYQGREIETNKEDNKQLTSNQQATNKQLTTNKNDKNNKNDKKYLYIREFTSNEILIQTINDFITMRKTIKKPLTDRALQLMLNKLKGLSENEDMQIKILEQSIENSWQGVFPLKGGNDGTSNRKHNKPEHVEGIGFEIG